MADWTLQTTAPIGHGDPANAVLGVWSDKVVLIGGDTGEGNSTLISSYDPATDTWATLGNLSTGAVGRGCVVGDIAYWYDFDTEALRSVNLNTLSEDAYDEALLWDNFAYNDELYAVEEESTDLRKFNPSNDTWSVVTGSVPEGHNGQIEIAVDASTGVVYVHNWVGVSDSGLHSYNIHTDTWTQLQAPAGRYEGPAVVADGKLYIFETDEVQVYDIATDSWSTDTMPAGMVEIGGAGIINGTAFAISVDFEGAWNLYTASFAEEEPEDLDTLTVIVSVELPVQTGDAYLTINVDIDGGTATTADLLIMFNTGRVIYAPAPVIVSVDPTPPTWNPPDTSTPEGNNAVIQPREWTDCEAPRAGDMCNSDEYAIDWRPGGQAAGTVTGYGLDAEPTPEPGLNLEGEYDTSIEWSYGQPTTTTRAYRQTTVETAGSELLPELMPVDQLSQIPGVTLGGCLEPVTANLCGDDPIITCMAQGMLPDILPTRLELAHEAAQTAQVELFILNGFTGLPRWDESVDVEYRTEGKTLTTVLTELLLEGGAPHWFAPGVVMVNGGGLPDGAFARPDNLGQGGSVALEAAEAYSEAEPQLTDYTSECAEFTSESDPCEGETFETAASGVMAWVERADGAEVHHRLEKSGGQVIREEVTKWALQWQLQVGVGDGNIVGTRVLAPVEWQVRDYTYLACCPGALTHTIERTWVAPRNTDPSADWEDAYGVKLATAKEVTQRWHAEGWLASRIETEWTQHGFRTGWNGTPTPGSELSRFQVIPTYKTASRVERYVPVGRGYWHVHISVTEGMQMPVDDGAAGFEVVGSHWGERVNSWTQVTDQAPPQVSCGSSLEDPCGTGDCVTDKTAEWQKDHDAWEAISEAWVVNHPEKVVTTVTYPGRVTSVLPGAIAEEGMVAAVSWQGAGVRTGRPSETTTVEYWSAVAS